MRVRVLAARQAHKDVYATAQVRGETQQGRWPRRVLSGAMEAWWSARLELGGWCKGVVDLVDSSVLAAAEDC